MCGIIAIFGASAVSPTELRRQARESSNLLRHRGPDWCGTYVSADTSCAIGHERLAIVDPESGEQPLFNAAKSVVLGVNGEIYNHEELKARFFKDYPFYTKSDCEVIIPLFEKFGHTAEMVDQLDGMFAFVLYDSASGEFMIARDPIGVIPLYWGWARDGSLMVASEMKALQGRCERFEQFPPGHFYSSKLAKAGNDQAIPWYLPMWRMLRADVKPQGALDLTVLRESFEKAVVKRMMTDVPWGVLLSGGLDSSLVAAVAKRHVDANSGGKWPALHSFCIGLEGSPDLAAAEKVASFLGTVHHAYTFTVADALDALSDVIYHLETYDVTTIRAGTPMFLMSRKIKAMGVKMVISGEGADEIFGGYLYFHKAPNALEFHQENVRKLADLYNFDCLRANKSTSAWGVEARVPFLDREFLDVAFAMDPKEKMCVDPVSGKPRMEKWILRKAFDTPEDPFLPDEVLWRQKEQFSDGVGYNWIDSLRAHADNIVSDRMFTARANRFPHNTPPTKEAYMVREIFERHFPSMSARETVPGGPSIACSSSAAIEWDESFKKAALAVGGDNSGRSVDVHAQAYDDVSAEATRSHRPSPKL